MLRKTTKKQSERILKSYNRSKKWTNKLPFSKFNEEKYFERKIRYYYEEYPEKIIPFCETLAIDPNLVKKTIDKVNNSKLYKLFNFFMAILGPMLYWICSSILLIGTLQLTIYAEKLNVYHISLFGFEFLPTVLFFLQLAWYGTTNFLVFLPEAFRYLENRILNIERDNIDLWLDEEFKKEGFDNETW